MSLSPLTITGVSSFSDNLQTILNRAVSIASLPVTALQNRQADLLVQKQLLSGISTGVNALADALAALKQAGDNKALTASSSNASRVSVTLNGATTAGVYTLSEISSVARAASENTAAGYATADSTAVDADGELQLVFANQTYTIHLSPEQNNLNGLRDAINGLGLGLRATVLNTGTGANPYYLTLTASSTGATTLALRSEVDNPASNILTSDNQGSNAIFKLNGLSVEKSDNVVSDVIPGVAFTIVSKTAAGETVTLTVASNRASLASAIEKMVAAYNSLRDQLNAQVGENAGLLSGDFIVRHVQAKLRELAGFRAPDLSMSLAELGIGLDSKGVMSFDRAKFDSLPNSRLETAFSLFGGSGGFGALESRLRNVSDPANGLIRLQQNQIDATDARIRGQIEAIQKRIEVMRNNLARQLQMADTLLARLESQQRFLDANLESLNLVLYGKRDRR
jgi:flagellar hook-associated protein 2